MVYDTGGQEEVKMNKIDLDVESCHWAINPLAGPIVLVTTVNAHGWVNIAPKSWVSFVSSKPFRLVLGCHREHHTAMNLLENSECVINLPSDDLVQKVWNAHVPLLPSPDELMARLCLDSSRDGQASAACRMPRAHGMPCGQCPRIWRHGARFHSESGGGVSRRVGSSRE